MNWRSLHNGLKWLHKQALAREPALRAFASKACAWKDEALKASKKLPSYVFSLVGGGSF